MPRKIHAALISVYTKTGLEPIVRRLHHLGVEIYSTGGTQAFIEALEVPCHSVESLTGFPSILGGRVKTLHPKIFGGILARRAVKEDHNQLMGYEIPMIDLVIVDLYPFEETVASSTDEAEIIEKIDIGGVSLIRAAAKNYNDVCVVASREQYDTLQTLLNEEEGISNPQIRKKLATEAFAVCANYDMAIARYFNPEYQPPVDGDKAQQSLRYGENPHQEAQFVGDISKWFTQLAGKELSYNNLVDADAACQLIAEFKETSFAVIKHTNVCGFASKPNLIDAWEAALAGDKESAFGGVLITNAALDVETAKAIDKLFFEILIAPSFDADALEILMQKKNRILLQQKKSLQPKRTFKQIFDGTLQQDGDREAYSKWEIVTKKEPNPAQVKDMKLANMLCKHLKSNAIAIVKDDQLLGKGCGQTSRIDALQQAVQKAQHAGFEVAGSALASDAFFPFDDCVKMAQEHGITSIIQPGGSIRDKDSIAAANDAAMCMVFTGTRHFRH